jgi:NAD(P)-dependent dehydrogenase (short-subunit alcohol dehydrogenase family)
LLTHASFRELTAGYAADMAAKRQGRVAVVTGASAGVGRATAIELARRGDSVALIARGEEGLAGAERDVAEAGGRALAIPTDVADHRAVERAAEQTEAELGPIDVWVNDAMATIFSPFSAVEPDEFQRAAEVTFLGFVWGTRSALNRMRPRNRGVIVQVSSALAFRGIPLQSAYCASKHAIKGFTESVRTELMADGSDVKLSMVHLPAVNTPQFDVGRTRMSRHPMPVPPIYQPEVPARAIAWATEAAPRDHYVGAPVWKTIWGNRIAPWAADLYLARKGIDSQLTDQAIDPRARDDNLFDPASGDRGAHGDFDDQARSHALTSWIGRHSGVATAVAAAGALGAGAALASRR